MMADLVATNGSDEANHVTALLVVDVQVAVITGEDEHWDVDGVLGRIGGLLDKARTAGTPVIYVQHEAKRYAPMLPGADGWQVHPAIAPLSDEARVRKRACDSFYDTTLEAELSARGIRSLVVCGCDSGFCVDTTVRSALSHGYDVTLVSDAHTTGSSSTLTAPQIIAHVNETLDDFHPDRSCKVIPAAEVTF